MSAAKHAPEPWRMKRQAHHADNVPSVWDKHGVVAVMSVNRHLGEAGPSATELANAARIVACVNWCEGLDTEGMNQSGESALTVVTEYAALKHQRDKLAAALRQASAAISRFDQSPASDSVARHSIAALLAARNSADDALAKLEGQS